MIANRTALQALLAARDGAAPPASVGALRANLTGEPVAQYSWRAARYSIWGDAAVRTPDAIVAKAPEELRDLYRRILITD